MRNAARPVLLVLLVAFAARGLALWAARDAVPVLDEVGYAKRAEALLDGRGFLGSYQSWVRHEGGRPADLPQYPGAWQPPGYVAFAAAAMAVLGRDPLAVKAVQVLLGTATVWLVFALGRDWFGRREGLVAAWLCALYPNLVAFSHYLWSETLFTFLLLLPLWLLTRDRGVPSLSSALGAGALLGLAALTRAAIVLFLPALAVWLLWVHRRAPRPALRAALLVPLAALLVIAPWSARNTRLHGGFVLIETNGPYNLWRGNGPGAFEDRCAPHTQRYHWPFDCIPIYPVGNRYAWVLLEDLRRERGNAAPSDIEVIDYAREVAWREIRASPATFLARTVPRLVDLWNPTSFLVRHFAIGAYGPVGGGWQLAIVAAAELSYLFVMAAGLLGAWRNRREPRVWLVGLLALFVSGVSAVSFGLTRFRLPLMPLFMVLAAPALARRPLRSPGRAGIGPVALAALALATSGCGAGRRDSGDGGDERPNLLVVVWDTARADHSSLYGYPRATTPHLDAWAAGARVFDDAVSAAGYTLPSHASMFTGLLPSEHCVDNAHPHLADRFTTVAELLRGAGYRTFLYSANPHVSAGTRNLAQGFDEVEHPWSPRWAPEAQRIVQAKLSPEDRSSELPERLRAAARGAAPLTAWNIKAAGELAARATLDWLARSDASRPWFVFLNYMEAHRPYIPPREYRARFLSPPEVAASYGVDRSWLPIWEYTFGLREYSERELELTRATYDASLAELDALFDALLGALRDAGHLDRTAVLLTSDHGEHLGEQHMFDHQYSLYEPVLRIPLVLWYPAALAPGRDASPVSGLDVFPTLLELAGLEPPEGTGGVSLLSPSARRTRLAEDPSSSEVGIAQVQGAHADFDPTPFRRRLRAWIDLPYKYLWSSDGRHELFDLASDPVEAHDLLSSRPALAERLDRALAARVAGLAACREGRGDARVPPLSSEERERLRSLGYLPEG